MSCIRQNREATDGKKRVKNPHVVPGGDNKLYKPGNTIIPYTPEQNLKPISSGVNSMLGIGANGVGDTPDMLCGTGERNGSEIPTIEG